MREISRRALLQGFGVAGILAFPLVRPRAQQLEPIKRFITYFSSSGVRQDLYFPNGEAGDLASGSYDVQGKTLDVLEPHLNDLIITKGLDIYRGGGDDHDNGSITLLTGNRVRDNDQTPYALGESLDQYLARTVGTETPEPILLLGTRLERNRASKWLSFDEDGNYKDWNQDPYSVYSRLFQGFFGDCNSAASGADAARDLLTLRRKSVLDSVMSESGALKRAYGMDAEEQQKLERLETAIRGVERRLENGAMGTSPVMTCEASKATFETDAPVQNSDRNFPELLKLNIDLLALAVELDVTRVITMSLSLGGSGGAPMTWLEYDGSPINASHHNISHGLQRGVEEHIPKLEIVDRWNFQQFAYLLDKLKAIQEGEATALDNSIVWHASDVSDGEAHSTTNMPFMIAGRAAGALKSGRYEVFQGNPQHQRLLLTFAHLMGQEDLTYWGLEEPSDGGPLLL